MSYYFLCFLFLSSLTNVSGEEPYMIRILGKPGKVKTSEAMNISWMDCLTKCRLDVDCSAVYKLSDVQCQYFSFGSISTLQKADFQNDEIAVKIQISQDQCPTSNPLIPGPNYYTQIINGQFYMSSVSPYSLSNNIYNLTYSVATCPNNTKLFQRGETTKVCIGLFFFEDPRCNNQAAASALCKAQNGTLTGPANANEYEYIQDISNSSKYSSNPDSYEYVTYWLDGAGTNTAYTFEDTTHDGTTNYQWAEGVTRSKGAGQCLHNPNPLYFNISEYPCTATFLTKAVCWRGALCQVPPIIETY